MCLFAHALACLAYCERVPLEWIPFWVRERVLHKGPIAQSANIRDDKHKIIVELVVDVLRRGHFWRVGTMCADEQFKVESVVESR
jgi:hypothetical protein